MITMEYSSGIVFTILLLIVNINAATFNDSNSLYTYLTSGRNKNLRPHTDTSKPTEVFVDFFLINLQEINAVEGTVSLTGYFQVKWKDPNMTWNGLDYNSIYYMQVPERFLWKPPLINGNSAKEMKFLGIDGLLTTVEYDGSISWYPGQKLEFSCDIDTTYFPFDKQECELELLTWGFSGSDLTLNTSYSRVQTIVYNENSEWDLEGSSVLVSNSPTFASTVKFKLEFRRRPIFLLATLLTPLILLALLNIAVFLLPQESGERIGFCITLLLAVVVFLTIAQGLLPVTAQPRLLSICIILMIDLMMSGLTLLSVIISCRIYYKPELIIPNWVQKLLRLERKCCLRGNKVKDEQDTDCVMPFHEKGGTAFQDKPVGEVVVWPDVARVWDKLNMLGYLIMFIAGNLTYFVDIYIGTLK